MRLSPYGAAGARNHASQAPVVNGPQPACHLTRASGSSRVLPAEQPRARADPLRDRARDDDAGRLHRQSPAPARGHAARALRRPPGGAARARRPHPRVRAHDGGRPLRQQAGGDRGRRERDRHHLPARPDATGADPHALAPRPRALHRRQHPPVQRGSRKRRGRCGDRRRERVAALALAPGGRGARGLAAGQRPAPLRRLAQRDDRHADRPRVRARKPRADGRARSSRSSARR